MTFEQISEGSKGVGHVDLWGKSTAEATAGTKSEFVLRRARMSVLLG